MWRLLFVSPRFWLAGIEPLDIFNRYPAKHFPDKLIKEVHDPDFYEYLKKICAGMKEKESVYPYVFPIRNQTRPPKNLTVCAGYYCLDTFTPLNKNAFLAARNAVDCTLTAAEKLLEGYNQNYPLQETCPYETYRLTSRLNFPTLIVQEGGYRFKSLGIHARSFFQGLHESH